MKEALELVKKIGRNEKCPCGSGLKYKKCCGNITDKRTNHEDSYKWGIENQDEGFVMLNQKVSLLKPIMQKYRFDDLVRAVYCININIKNRSLIENMLSLNKVLIEFEAQGDLTIKDYDELKIFFYKIKEILSKTVYDDYIIEDFGEVKVIWDDEHYEAIIGTGYEQTYGYYQFIPETVKMNKTEKLYREILAYNTDRIKFFKEINKSDALYDIEFSLPENSLFERTQKYLERFEEPLVYKEIIDYFIDNTHVSQMHFVEHNGKQFPLFNTSILMDFYSKELTNKPEEKITEIIDFSIISILSKLSKLQNPKNPVALFPVAIVDEKSYVSRVIYTFLLMAKDGVILAINAGRYSEKEINDEIKLLNQLLSEGGLMFAEVIARNQSKEKIGIRINADSKIKVLLYENVADPTVSFCMLKEREENYLKCLAVDIVYLLLFMDNIDQISRFYDYKLKSKSTAISYGGIADHFFTWKDSGEIIEKGAIRYDMISLASGNSDGYVFEYFKEKIKNYPLCDNDSLFDGFHSWKIKPKENGFYEYVSKINGNFGGDGHTYKNNCFLFYVHNIEFYKEKGYSEKIFGLISLIDDLNLRNARLYNNWFETNVVFNNKIIQLMFMPIDYAKSIDHNGFTIDSNRTYVYSDVITSGNNIIIRYTVNEEKLYSALEKATNRSVEATYYLELLQPLEEFAYNEYQQLKQKVISEFELPKGVGVVSITADYIWSGNTIGYHVSDMAYHLVRKEIAKICTKNGIEVGEYSGKDTNKMIRIVQSELIVFFEGYINKFDRFELHIALVGIYSKVLHDINIHKKRYDSFDNIEDYELSKMQHKAIQLREEEKHHLRVVEFALETNLYLENQRGTVKLSSDDIEFILAFSNWMVVLFDTADICHKSESDKHINVRDDFVIDIVDSDEMLDIFDGINKRVYDNNDYSIRLDYEDKAYLDDAITSFRMDTGMDFLKLLTFLDFMTLLYSYEFASEIQSNVYSLNKEEMINSFTNEYEGKIDRQEILNMIEYLTIEPKMLKIWKGNVVDFLPIGERENRPHRFNLKPIVEINNQIVFSPALMSDLHKRWKFGMTDFYLPLEVGIENTVKSILSWKKRYEDLIVDDVYQNFKDIGITNVWKEVELHKLDKKSKHPNDLGDFDVIAYDKTRNMLWVIECKVLNKVGSIHENIMQQYNFFLNKKYDEKFQKRIDYIVEHSNQFLEAQQVELTDEIIIRPYMITNKVFISRYKKVRFEIVTLNEFENLLKEEYEEHIVSEFGKQYD